jgi:2,4-dichlorophenol 6-monooxygenase
VVADHLPAPTTDPEFYTPCVRAGGRLPHAWIDERERRVSTLDLIGDNELTLLVSESSRPAWEIAAADLPVRLKVLGEIHRQVWSTPVPGADPDALLVRPDGHIGALLRSVADDAPALRSALRAVKVPLPECDTEIADLPHRS